MLEVTSEIQSAAMDYKRRIAGMFMLVEPKKYKERLMGSEFCVTRKIDGVMAYAVCRKGEAVLVGARGRDLSELSCVKQLAKTVKAAGIDSMTLVAELYAPAENGRPRVYDVLSALADSSKAANLRLAPFDIVELGGEPFKSSHYKEIHAKLAAIFKDDALRPVEMKTATSADEVMAIYDEWVADEGAEGLVVHSEAPIIWKIKPRHTVDAAVIGYTSGEDFVRDLLFAVRHEDGTFQIFGVASNGLADEQRHVLWEKLSGMSVESDFIQTDSHGIAFRMVRPELVFEMSFGDLLAETSGGKIKYNPVLEFDGEKWIPKGRVPGVSAIFPVVDREREDKTVEPVNVRVSQLSDICPFAEVEAKVDLQKSTLLKRRVFKKTSKDKVMLQKFIAWKTNKESDPRYPAYVFHYTDFSSGRKDPLKKDIRIAPTEEQILGILDTFIAENIKKGWEEVNS